MANNPVLSVVLPAYMEAENLRLLLPRLNKTLRGLDCASEVIVVDANRPTDGSREVCLAAGVTYVNREGNDSFGNAIRTGIAAAAGEYVVFMDSDGSHTPEFIPELYAAREQADVVVASRYVDGGETRNPAVLIAMSRALNFIYSIVLGIPCRDVSNSFKLYRAGPLKQVSLYCDNFDIVEEILFKLVRNNPGLRILELPFTFERRKFGETKRNLAVFMLSFLATLLRLRFGR